MENERRNISAEDKFEGVRMSPRFDEETKAAARPVVPLGSTRGVGATVRRVRSPRPLGVALILVITVVVGIAASLIYTNSGTGIPSDTPPTVSETVIKSVLGTASLSPTSQPVRAREFEARETPRKRAGRPSVPAAHDEPAGRDWRDEGRGGDDEEKFAGRARKEGKKRLKRLRKEAGKLAGYERDAEEGDKPKARLVGVYAVRRKH